MNKEKEFLMELAELMKKYNVEIENMSEGIHDGDVYPQIDFNFNDTGEFIDFNGFYIDYKKIKGRAKSL